MADVFLLTFLRLAGLGQLGGILPLEHLHPGLFVDADDQTPFLVATEGVDIQRTDVPGFRVKIGVMAIEPMVLVYCKLLNDYRTIQTNGISFWACSRQTTLPRWYA